MSEDPQGEDGSERRLEQPREGIARGARARRRALPLRARVDHERAGDAARDALRGDPARPQAGRARGDERDGAARRTTWPARRRFTQLAAALHTKNRLTVLDAASALQLAGRASDIVMPSALLLVLGVIVRDLD